MGMTLVEVMAGLVILGTLMVAMVMAKSRYVRQWSQVNQRLEAVAAADRLLCTWWQDLDTFPCDESGRVPDRPHMIWRTRVVPNEVIDDMDARVIRLEIAHGDGTETRNTLVTVELVLPNVETTEP